MLGKGVPVAQTLFTLRQLEYLVATAETGKIRAAADRCHISPVSLGSALSELERALGMQLLIRRRAKGITLTPIGKEVLAMARAVLAKATEIHVAADDTAEGLAGTLQIGCHTALGLMILPEVCDTFAREHPDLRIAFRDDSQDTLQQLLLEGEIEAAILYERRLADDIDSLPVVEMRPHILVSAQHRLAQQREVWLEDLADEPLIRLDIPTMTGAPKGWNPHAPHGYPSLSTSNVELLRALVGRGLGYALVGQRGGSSLAADGHPVVALRVRDEIPPIRVVIAFPRGASLSRAARGLVDFVRGLPF